MTVFCELDVGMGQVTMSRADIEQHCCVLLVDLKIRLGRGRLRGDGILYAYLRLLVFAHGGNGVQYCPARKNEF